MTTDASGKISAKIKALFCLIVISLPFVVFLFMELLARAIVDTSPSPMAAVEALYVPSQNFQLIYELNPQNPEVNSFGMRQAEFDRATLHEQFVIAVIGDSHTYSVKSPDRDNAFPARLERHLTALAGKPIKVLNFGVPGYDMHQELEVLKAKALAFEPDLVILQ